MLRQKDMETQIIISCFAYILASMTSYAYLKRQNAKLPQKKNSFIAHYTVLQCNANMQESVVTFSRQGKLFSLPAVLTVKR